MEKQPQLLPKSFFERDPVTCARELIGQEFHWHGCSGTIVETEAYAEIGDEACHTFFRPSTRKFVADHSAGDAYVYLNYGMYWLTNVLIKGGSSNGFVLLRALKPVSGIQKMKRRRKRDKKRDLCSGPGKLSMALGINGADHGRTLISSAKRCFAEPNQSSMPEVIDDIRIGISKAQDFRWRFLASGSEFVSVKPQG